MTQVRNPWLSSAGLIKLIAIAMACYHIWIVVPPLPDSGFGSPAFATLWNATFRGPPTDFFLRGAHLLFALVLAFLLLDRKSVV